MNTLATVLIYYKFTQKHIVHAKALDMRRESGVQVHSLKLVAKQQMLHALVGLECSL